MKSCLYQGRVRHRRYTPADHVFEYRVVYAYLDLDELDSVFNKRWFWSTRRPAPVRFKRSDYLGDANIPLKQAVLDRVEAAGNQRPSGPVRMLTHLRYLGFVFNPVSFYFCFNEDETRLESIVAEITNTPWGERYAYVLPTSSAKSNSRHWEFDISKSFHVSPFMPMDMEYRWYFSAPQEKLQIHMINLQDGVRQFDATLALHRRSMNAGSCALALAAYPLMPVKVIAAIYWQALKLYLKGIPFYPHPETRDTKHTGGARGANSR